MSTTRRLSYPAPFSRLPIHGVSSRICWPSWILKQRSCRSSPMRSSKNHPRLGLYFWKTATQMHTIDLVYCEYCKRHQDAVTRLQELATRQEVQHFLQECAGQLQGKTQSWDLGSLLIKPVQRVLKYPLLLKELMMTTSMDHGDDEDLVQATSAIENVADHINEIKRRKDIVERIVNDKKKGDINVVHGLNKKISRKAQQIRQVAGLMATETTQDSTFDALYQRFEAQQQVVQQLIRDIQAWVRQIKDHFDTLLVLATTLDDVYGAFGGVRVRSMNQIKDFTSLASTFSMLMSRELDASVRGYIYGRIDDFLAVYDNPTQVINKRAQKLLDYDRWRDIKARGDVPDKVLQESADMYLSINAQLAEELPLFLDMTGQYLHLIIGDLARVQSKFYQQLIREWSKLTQLFKHPFVPHTSNNSSPQAVFDPIVMEYHRHFDRYVDLLVSDITILQPVHSESASLDDTSS
ncbi:hypothetical protein DM01DRAFT_1048992 [Hesseltinella vesiculosa]|uniref:Dynamin-binding protein n=1 Tax=Hesseltinella vesiculosa TaxID=101127 RepID=A0A1X2GHC4_9FUNG|nr:hypothetical protein DM01DRAFT_1048992 [Hesseltinella vesiculosa]